jgi:hypothetical protein
MAKRKGQDKQHNDQKKSVACPFGPFLLDVVWHVLLSFSFGHCVACPSVLFFWSLCCLSFCPKRKGTEGQETQLPKENDRRTSNTMTKKKGQKDKQHNGQKKGTEGQATKWPKKGDRRTSNTMTKGK